MVHNRKKSTRLRNIACVRCIRAYIIRIIYTCVTYTKHLRKLAVCCAAFMKVGVASCTRDCARAHHCAYAICVAPLTRGSVALKCGFDPPNAGHLRAMQ